MDWLIPLAAKSFAIAGGALLLLKLFKNRSAADRSWIAHLALAGLLLLPVASFALPTLDLAGPEFLVGKADVQFPSPAPLLPEHEAAAATASAPEAGAMSVGSASIAWPFWGYAIPSALLVLLTLIALGRLFLLKSRATVLVDAPWLTALARAQQRMGFKHGTALLTSDALPSPISWGVVRPVILLNAEAADSHAQAEAIITHELAHVANLDWAKLMIARIATALLWFNPFVWLLAREAHQLREEAADDAVLATDIEDTEYAKLLVGVARHECRGFLLGAHGVAPAKNSLARRVRRVLDGAVKRAPGGWRWGSAVAFFAAGMAVPVAALNLVPATATAQDSGAYYPRDSAELKPGQPSLADIVANATVAAVAGATENLPDGVVMTGPNGATVTTKSGTTVMTGSNGATVTVYAADKEGRRKVVMIGPNGARMVYPDARLVPGLAAISAPPARPHTAYPPHSARSELDTAIEMKAVGVTAQYAAAIRAALPGQRLSADDLIGMKAVGVTPEYARELATSGYHNLNVETITDLRAVGVTGAYIRELARAGYNRLTLDQLTSLRAVGVTPAYIERLRQLGYRPSPDKLVEMKVVGVEPDDIRRGDGG